MFTGIVQAIGRVVEPAPRLVIDANALDLTDVRLGDSIAVSGVCLTVVALDGHRFVADVSRETTMRTTLGTLAADAPVNLEKALRLADRLGGHLVTGHVDGVGRVTQIDGERWSFEVPRALARYIATKGSICVDGISLTVNGVGDRVGDADTFDVAIIPHTLAVTTLGAKRPGDAVNIEVDLMARYAERLVRA